MFKLKRIRAPIYVVFITSTILLWSDGVELNTIDTKEIRLPLKYKDYVDVFSEEETSKFPDSTRVKYPIPIEEGVEVPHSPIY
jgi:hypothetical protein